MIFAVTENKLCLANSSQHDRSSSTANLWPGIPLVLITPTRPAIITKSMGKNVPLELHLYLNLNSFCHPVASQMFKTFCNIGLCLHQALTIKLDI